MKNVMICLALLLTTVIATAQQYKGSVTRPSVESKLNELYCTGLFKSTDGTILHVESNASKQGFMNILDWLPGRVAGLQVYPSRNGVSIPLIRGNVPGVYIDEIPVALSTLSTLNVNDIAIVKIIKTPFYGGFNGGHGAIAVYTIGSEEEEEEE